MSTDRTLPHEAAAAEALLDGRGDRPAELVGLLAHATAPAHPAELGGEAAALAAFRAARSVLTSPHRHASRRGGLARLLTVKAAAAAAVLAVGGVAIAATAAYLPEGAGDAGRGGMGANATRSSSSGTHGNGDPSRSGGPSAGSPASPSPSLAGLCRAYEAAVAENPGRARTNPAFTALIVAAGGVSRVADFCAAQAASPVPGATPSPGPPGGGPPEDRPGDDKPDKEKPSKSAKPTHPAPSG